MVVRPKKFGYFNFTSAEVRYKSGEEGGVTKVGFSSDPGQGLIIALKDYERQFSAHMVSYWIIQFHHPYTYIKGLFNNLLHLINVLVTF